MLRPMVVAVDISICSSSQASFRGFMESKAAMGPCLLGRDLKHGYGLFLFGNR